MSQNFKGKIKKASSKAHFSYKENKIALSPITNDFDILSYNSNEQTLEPNFIRSLEVEYAIESNINTSNNYIVKENFFMNGRSEVISIKESHNSNERIEDIWILDNNTNLTLQRDTEFQIPIPLQNSTDFDYFQTNSFTFGKTTTNIKKDENFDFIYELSSCESGSITEYGKKSSYRVPFEMNIHYINGKSEILKGNFERNVFEKGDVKFIHISNDNCS